MDNMENIVKLAVDAHRGKVENYSVKQSQEVLRKALIEVNNNKETLNYRDIRDGKCQGLFTLVEEILRTEVVEGLQGDEYFMALVDFRNLAESDQNVFVVKDSTLYVVAEAANGTQGIRRQRLGDTTQVSVPTTLKIVRIYEELNRVLSGRIDFNEFIDKVAESFKKKLLDDIYALWNNATAAELGGATYFPVAAPYDEDDLLDLISHVEAAAGGKKATIIGTKKALRKLMPAVISDTAREDVYNLGYVGKFYGTPVVATPQRHKVGTTDFVFDDDYLTIVAGEDKPIKLVYEGDPLILLGDPANNADLTQEYLYAEKYGLAIVLAGGNSGLGRYEMTD